MKYLSYIFGFILLFGTFGPAQAQKRQKAAVQKAQAETATSAKEFKESFIKASEDYKASLQTLLALYEADVKKRTDQTATIQGLYNDGLISKKEFESMSGDITAAQAKVAEVKKQIATTDLAIAEVRREPRPDELQNAQMALMAQNAPPWTTGNASIDTLIRQNGARYGVDPYFIYCVIKQESSFNMSALSVKGAQGLMQLMPGTAARYGVTNSNDAAQNIRGGTRYLKDLLELFHGRIDLVLAGYNAGEGAVIKYGQTIPPYKETKDYVRLISQRYLARPATPKPTTKKGTSQ
jgi:soluble lytic murein transglycosylase-like protein